MSRAENSNGLILASSPTFKKVFGKSNVGRARDLPFDIDTRKFNFDSARRQNLPITKTFIKYIESWAEKTLIVPPRMALYIEENMKIQKIFTSFAAEEDILTYSIDEGFIDLTSTLNYFVKDKSIDRKEKLNMVSAKIQRKIFEEIGVYSTVGMSNSNPLLAKLALDNEAKNTKMMRANWSYEDVETKVWKIKKLTDFWGIGSRMEKRLNNIFIYSVKDLANANPDILSKKLGVYGLQLWFHANGIDESKASKPYTPKSKSLGNSQILPRDYESQDEIEIVLREMAEQVAIRIRRKNKKASVIGIHLGFSCTENKKSINAQMTITPSQSTKILSDYVIELFRKKYKGGKIRSIGVRYEKLVDDSYSSFSFFDDVKKIEKFEKLDKTIDELRDRFGFISVQKANSLLDGSRTIERSKLIGGHCGGMDGVQ